MNAPDALRAISDTLLYEGCMLYPYRASALKNRRPGWTFGALLPLAYAAANPGESDFLQSQVLALAPDDAELLAELRFLQFHSPAPPGESALVERCVAVSARLSDLRSRSTLETFAFPGQGSAPEQKIDGAIAIAAEPVAPGVFRVTLRVRNASRFADDFLAAPLSRDQALIYSLLSANVLLVLSSGKFSSQLDPPASLGEVAAACRQIGVFPVLAGDPETQSAMLVSPIILYDFPRVAPETRGEFFDSSEIDEMLALRVLTLSEAERAEIRRAGHSPKEILERTEALSSEEMRKLHGTFRPCANPAETR